MNIKVESTIDAEVLSQLNKIVQLWHNEHYPKDFKPYIQDKIEHAFKKMLKDSNIHAFIARSGQKPIGYIICKITRQPESAFQYEKVILNIDQIAVLEAYRNSGVGKLLLDAVFYQANKEGASEIRVDHWSGNISAENFFVRNGFSYFNYRMKKVVDKLF